MSVRCGLHTGECELLDGDVDFDYRGAHELRGEPGEWRLYAVSN